MESSPPLTEQPPCTPGVTSPIELLSGFDPQSSGDQMSIFPFATLSPLHFFQVFSDRPWTVTPGGLYMDIWLLIMDLFKKNGMMLLSFALTCRAFRRHAQALIYHLFIWSIDPTTYQDINELAAVIESSPQNSKYISSIYVDSSWNVHEIAFSTIPVKLSNKLSKINSLHILNSTVKTHFHPLTWRLYGCAFSTITQLTLVSTEFPSFVDFASLITSFSTLSSLSLYSISCRSHAVPLSITRAPRKCKLKLKSLELRNLDTWFMLIFEIWFAQIGSALTGKLKIPFSIFQYAKNESIFYLSQVEIKDLEVMSLQNLQARDIEPFLYQNLNKLQLQSMKLETINFSSVQKTTIASVNLILPFIIKYVKRLELQSIYLESASDLYSSAWATLDILLSAMYIRQYMSSNIQVVISLTASEYNIKIAQSHFSGSQQQMMRSLFPLITSLGEGIWVELEKKVLFSLYPTV